jgi:hypothetical protein
LSQTNTIEKQGDPLAVRPPKQQYLVSNRRNQENEFVVRPIIDSLWNFEAS